jgi:diguanylate cyclase (GGDEF)-like protein
MEQCTMSHDGGPPVADAIDLTITHNLDQLIEADRRNAVARATEAGVEQQSARIMIVDDEPIALDVLAGFLEEAGYADPVLTEDSAGALELARREAPDLVLLDLMMPNVDGFEVLQRLRAEEGWQHLPVIVLTAAADADTKLRALKLGATDFLAKPVDASELVLRIRNTLVAKAYHDRQRTHDALTGMPNRAMFEHRLGQALRRVELGGHGSAVLHLDLVGFRRVNDALGPRFGDELLRMAGMRLGRVATAVRRGDDVPAPLVARLGADDFGILLWDASDAEAFAHSLGEEMQRPFVVGGQEAFLGVAVGVAPLAGESDVGRVLQRVGAALAAAQAEGGGVRVHSPELEAQSRARLSLEAGLRRALKRDELVVFFQPKVAVDSGRICGAEALVRWAHPERGLLAPGHFIGAAEDSGLIREIGAVVLDKACAQLDAWRQQGFSLPKLAVNVAPLQLDAPGFVDSVEAALKRHRLAPERLIVEVTESSLMRDVKRAVALLQSLRDMGVGLSVDDFGTGYSSLNYLTRLPLTELKVDRSFVSRIGVERDGTTIVTAIVAMAHGLNLSVTAEGVEEARQLQYLRSLGCELYQGYLCSPPVDAEAFRRLALKNAEARVAAA